MKLIKMFSCVALPAVVLLALGSVDSASATVLCKVNTLTEGCAAGGQAYPSGTEIVARSNQFLVTSGTEPFKCESIVSGDATTGGPTSTVESIGELTTLEFFNCNHTTDVKVKGSLEVHWIPGSDNGTVTSKGMSLTMITFGVSCTYGTPSGGKSIGDLTGGTKPIIHINVFAEKKEGSFLCPSEPIWEGDYTVTSPSPLYIAGS